MFGNQLEMLSLLLVGLSLAGLSNLSEAVHTYDELLEMLLQATDINDIHPIFVELGRPFQDYADLANLNVQNCIPTRILFDNRAGHLLGPVAQDYVTERVTAQQQLCEQTFIQRLTNQFEIYSQDWPTKAYFKEFITFVQPWPTMQTERDEMIHRVTFNLFDYYDWRGTQNIGSRNIKVIRGALIKASRVVWRLFGGFLASLKTGRPFEPPINFDQEYALMLAKIAEAVLVAGPSTA